MPNREDHLRLAYGISSEHYQWLLEKQGGVCAICGSANGGGRHEGLFYVDHIHGTKRVRGLLCTNCNLGLGKFADDPERLRRAADYIEQCGLSAQLESAKIPPARLEHKPRQSVRYSRKLDWAKVNFIRTAVEAKSHSQGELARLFGVTQAMVSRIALNKAWNTL